MKELLPDLFKPLQCGSPSLKVEFPLLEHFAVFLMVFLLLIFGPLRSLQKDTYFSRLLHQRLEIHQRVGRWLKFERTYRVSDSQFQKLNSEQAGHYVWYGTFIKIKLDFILMENAQQLHIFHEIPLFVQPQLFDLEEIIHPRKTAF